MGSSKKGGDTVDVPQVDPLKLIQEATKANRVNVSTPFGAQNYSTDANGNATLSTSMSPEMQALFAQQMARAGSPASQYTLPGQHGDILNGLNTRLDQRYGIPLPPPGPSGGTPGAGGGPAPGAPMLPPTAPPQIAPPQQAPALEFDYGGADDTFACVAHDSWLPYETRADKVEVGELFPVTLPEVGHHKWRVEYVGRPAHVHCVELKTKSGGVLRVSMTTPFTLPTASKDLEPEHTRLAPDMKGESVYVLTPAGVIEDEVTSVTEIGKEWVQPLDFGGRSFPAGDTPHALIYSHNMRKGPNHVGIPAQGADYTMAPQQSGAFSGSVSQGQSGISSYNPSSGNNFGIPMPGSGAETDFGIPMPGSGALAGFGGSVTTPGAGVGAANYESQFGAGFGLPAAPGYDAPALGSLPTLPGEAKPGWMQQVWDSKYLAPAAAALLGPLGGLAVKGAQNYTHRND